MDAAFSMWWTVFEKHCFKGWWWHKKRQMMSWKWRKCCCRGGQTTIHQKRRKKKKRSKKMKRTKCFSSSIQLFIQPCFSIQPADKIKRREERAHKTPIHKIKPIPNFYLGQIVCFKCVVWRSLSVFSFSLCGHEHRLFFYFLCLLVHVLQEAIFTSLLSLPLVMCYSYIELLFTKHNHKAIGHLHHRSVNIRGWKRTSWDDWEYFQSRLFFVTLRISNYCHYQK